VPAFGSRFRKLAGALLDAQVDLSPHQLEREALHSHHHNGRFSQAAVAGNGGYFLPSLFIVTRMTIWPMEPPYEQLHGGALALAMLSA